VNIEIWHILVFLGIVSFAIEIFTIGFVAGSVGIGFFFAAILNYLGAAIEWQIILFSIGVILTYFVIKPLFNKVGYGEKIDTNQDALINKTGRVTQEINPELNTGRVSIDGDDWKAISKNGDIVALNKNVKVVGINSIVLIVEPIN